MRFFIELSYKGSRYAGFQIQENAVTVQQEVEKALQVFYKKPVPLTGSSRTDSGVHARQNYFHFDEAIDFLPTHIYNLNAILPTDIVIKRIFEVSNELHCRFHAKYRSYQYFIYQKKDPFLTEIAWHFPYPVNLEMLNQAAELLMTFTDFTSFSKRNTQTHTRQCNILQSQWELQDGMLIYKVKANRFLRGMVRALVATQLLVGRGKITLDEFRDIIEAKNCAKANFAAPAHGLFLEEVMFDDLGK